jgi:hypothetical protein
MRKSRLKHVMLAAAVLAGATMGSIEWPNGGQPRLPLMRGGFTLSAAAIAGETVEPVRRAPCTLVRYYVARYSAAVAEAWARGKGATDAEIRTARRCMRSSAESASG